LENSLTGTLVKETVNLGLVVGFGFVCATEVNETKQVRRASNLIFIWIVN
jgi:hypothetical protein